MSDALRLLAAGVLVLLAVAGPAAMAQDDPEPESLLSTAVPDPTAEAARRIRSMPVERRRELVAQDRRFRSLPAEEQSRIRAIAEAIGQADPEQRVRLESIMRRYHLWLSALPEADQARLRSLDSADRIVAVRTLMKSHPLASPSRLDDALAVSSSLSPDSILDQAFTLKIWFRLTPAEREAVRKQPDPEHRQSVLRDHAERLGITPDRPALLGRAESEVRQRLEDRRRPGLEKALEAMKPQARRAAIARAVEARYFDGVRPAPTTQERLDRFVTATPDWIAESLDPLPPAAAQRRLTLLYRQVFPAPSEITESVAPATSGQPRTASPAPSAPRTPPTGGTTPF
jgi:hypothetical protein